LRILAFGKFALGVFKVNLLMYPEGFYIQRLTITYCYTNLHHQKKGMLSEQTDKKRGTNQHERAKKKERKKKKKRKFIQCLASAQTKKKNDRQGTLGYSQSNTLKKHGPH